MVGVEIPLVILVVDEFWKMCYSIQCNNNNNNTLNTYSNNMGNIILKAAAETTMIPFTALAALPDITCYFNCFPASITTEKSIATIVE